MQEFNKTGYLNQNFRLFHLYDTPTKEFEFHYHDFHKILLHLRGKVTYCIEGKSYELKPNDLIIVNKGEVHRPIIDASEPYERLILYISPEYLQKSSTLEDPLDLCFQQSAHNKTHLLRVPDVRRSHLYRLLFSIEQALKEDDFANELHCNLLFLECMVQLNREVLHQTMTFANTASGNEKILAILDYLNSHLSQELSVDTIASHFYISKFYLMHHFKQETGYTLGQYITTKRLLYANELIKKDTPVTQACLLCGFQNYTSFSRAYKKMFGISPTQFKEKADSASYNIALNSSSVTATE